MAGRSSYLEQIITKKNSTCTMQVVFVDIVAYSKRKSHGQVAVIEAFRQCLEAALIETAQGFEVPLQKLRLTLRDNVILVPAGDAASVCFPFDGLHDVHIRFATSLITALGLRSATADCSLFRRYDWCDCHDAMKVRIGISEGRVTLYKDINKNYNVAGTTVNVAARVMSVAEPNEVLLSEEAHRQVGDVLSGIATQFIGYSGVVVKHGLTLTVYQYVDKRLKYLNSTRQVARGTAVPPAQTLKTLKPQTSRPTSTVSPGKRDNPELKPDSTKVRRAKKNSGHPVLDAILSRMVEVPRGKFLMGEAGANEVHIRHAFLIDQYPVTQELYSQVTGASPSKFKGELLPVESVSWLEAVVFCNALSRQCGRKEVYQVAGKHVTIDYSASGFRLPTEAEWEYACGTIHLSPGEADLGTMAWYAANTKQTQAVGQLRPNSRGLFDMLGNVWEWCNDWYARKPPLSTLDDPIGPTDGLERVLRGGSWRDLASIVSSTYRGRRDPSQRSADAGFRVVVITDEKRGDRDGAA